MKSVFFILILFFTHSGFGQNADEKEVDLIREEIIKIPKTNITLDEVSIAEIEKKMTDSTIFDPSHRDQILKIFNENRYWERSPEEVKSFILEGARGKFAEKVFKKFPKTLDIVTDIIRDEQAVPGVLKMLDKKKELNQYFGAWLILLVGSWVIRKYFFPPDERFLNRTIISLFLTVSVSVASFLIFFFFFKTEISPLLRVLLRHL